MKQLFVALAALTLNAPTVQAQPTAQTAGAFTIGGERFAQADILDARALPGLDGGAEIMLTFDPRAAKRLEALTRTRAAQPIAIALDGRTIASPAMTAPVTDGVLTIAGGFSLTEAEALAKRISGKDPVPEEFEE